VGRYNGFFDDGLYRIRRVPTGMKVFEGGKTEGLASNRCIIDTVGRMMLRRNPLVEATTGPTYIQSSYACLSASSSGLAKNRVLAC